MKLYEVCIFDDMYEIRYLTVSDKTEDELKQFIDKSSAEYSCYMGCVVTEIKEVDRYRIKLEKTTKELEEKLKNIYEEIMKCPKCKEEMRELHLFLHHVKCENCEYEEEDIFITNEGRIK